MKREGKPTVQTIFVGKDGKRHKVMTVALGEVFFRPILSESLDGQMRTGHYKAVLLSEFWGHVASIEREGPSASPPRQDPPPVEVVTPRPARVRRGGRP